MKSLYKVESIDGITRHVIAVSVAEAATFVEMNFAKVTSCALSRNQDFNLNDPLTFEV